MESIIDFSSPIECRDGRTTKQKRFWSFIRSLREDSTGVSPLRNEGEIHSAAPEKAEILNKQFTSVFTHEPPGPLPDKGPSPHPTMPDICISKEGIQKMLHNIKPNKAAGPDSLPAAVLQELSHEIAPILEIIYRRSLQSGIVPNDWKTANIASIFKKGDKHKASNYRPVSLTCILGKCMEHIIVSNIATHLDTSKILNPLQHGFRKQLSCDTQLLSLFHDLASRSTETDVIVMDFSKAFDKVPHRRLLYKLDWYGIRGLTLDWVKGFLEDRTQKVVLDGTESLPGPVLSGVPQGSVLGPILFLLYINDLPDGTTYSTVRLFADDCIAYKTVTDKKDIGLLQTDLDKIAEWEEIWLMEFNVGKCFAMRVGRQRGTSKLDPPRYILHGEVLCITDNTKYLGLNITSDLKWNSHIQKVTAKANSVLGLLRRNLRVASKPVKIRAYEALVRPHLEYACSVWDPHTQVNIRRLDMVQRRAARYVCNRWHNTSSVSSMLNELDWESLTRRREKIRLCMMYKVVHGLVDIPWQESQVMIPNPQCTRGSHAWKYAPILPHNDVYKFSFVPRTIIAWNALPPDVVACPSLNTFRVALSTI